MLITSSDPFGTEGILLALLLRIAVSLLSSLFMPGLDCMLVGERCRGMPGVPPDRVPCRRVGSTVKDKKVSCCTSTAEAFRLYLSSGAVRCGFEALNSWSVHWSKACCCCALRHNQRPPGLIKNLSLRPDGLLVRIAGKKGEGRLNFVFAASIADGTPWSVHV